MQFCAHLKAAPGAVERREVIYLPICEYRDTKSFLDAIITTQNQWLFMSVMRNLPSIPRSCA